jgi:hypothetical protein
MFGTRCPIDCWNALRIFFKRNNGCIFNYISYIEYILFKFTKYLEFYYLSLPSGPLTYCVKTYNIYIIVSYE